MLYVGKFSLSEDQCLDYLQITIGVRFSVQVIKMRSRDTSNNAPSISSHRSELSATVINTPSTPGFLITPRNAVPTPFGSAFNSAAQNAEDDLDNPVQGWPQVAMLMAKTPDFASFSRFRDLNIKSLLYYQAELTRLRKKLHEEELEDARRGDAEASKYARRADMLINSEEPNDSQWELVKQIRVVLKEYSELNCRGSKALLNIIQTKHCYSIRKYALYQSPKPIT